MPRWDTLKISSTDLAASLENIALEERRPGRPRKLRRTNGEPTLLMLPSDKASKSVEHITDVQQLSELRWHELSGFGRKSVLHAIERQLRKVGVVKEEPFPDYDHLTPEEIVARTVKASAESLHEIYIYEATGKARRAILEASSRREAPFQGFHDLVTTPSKREQLKVALARQSDEDLLAAITFEQNTRQRLVILKQIKRELRSRRAQSSNQNRGGSR